MKERLIDFLICPICQQKLNLIDAYYANGEIKEGFFECNHCYKKYPIIDFIPRFLPETYYSLYKETSRNFAFSWRLFARIYEDPRDFLDWIKPVRPDFFKDKIVVDAGCGTGMHAVFAAQFGAREVIAFDFSPAVEVARENTRGFPQIHIIQADIFHLPLKACIDYIYCIGVLQHLPDPYLGFCNLVNLLRDNGSLSIWVYGYEGTEFVRYIIDPIRRITSRLPLFAVYLASFPPTAIFYLLTRIVNLAKKNFSLKKIPMSEYLAYMSQFSFNYLHNSVFDQLIAPITKYFRRDEVLAWFKKAGLSNIQISSRNEMSWRGFGQRLIH
ncbi:MAG: methyltransferase domain-containing protein [Candidatus Aminicenantes bacterium]|nr:methyltransferase domain-containing protein [Candidatus Aminicenantes bacterium]